MPSRRLGGGSVSGPRQISVDRTFETAGRIGEHRRHGSRFRFVRATILAGACLATVLGAVYLSYRDEIWVLHRRWFMAETQYDYDLIRPALRAVDPRDHMSIASDADALRVRRSLNGAIWGVAEPPHDAMPTEVSFGISDPVFDGAENLERIDALRFDMRGDTHSTMEMLLPAEANGEVVIYHHGYAGTFHESADAIRAFLGRGYAVVAINLMCYGGNDCTPPLDPPVRGKTRADLHVDFDLIENPLAFLFEPVVAAINYAQRVHGFRAVSMVGLSAGGWETAVAAAIDPRIRRSYPVSGVYPVYLREGQDLAPGIQFYRPMLEAASYLDMFVLATYGEGRRQLQVFNRYDRCCFNNTKGKLYEAAVQEAAGRIGAGRFAVLIDETHAEHKISPFAVQRILEDMASDPVEPLLAAAATATR